MRKMFFMLIFLGSLFTSNTFAQSRLGIFIGGGTTWYYGDMNDRIITSPKLFRTYFNGGLLYRLHSNWDLVANVTFGKIVGADSLAIQEFNRKRDLNFESKIFETCLLVNYKFLGERKKDGFRLNPYLIAGLGYLKFNPQTEFYGQKIDLQPLGTEGQNVSGRGYPKPYKLYTLSIPLGIGVEIPLSKVFSLRIEYANHFTISDYIDDISTKYADSTALANGTNGTLAVQLANNINTGYPREGYGRGNPKQRDSFSTLGISLLFTPDFSNNGGNSSGGRNKGVIGKKKKHKKSCPAFN